jgi:hypothetical protein
MDGGGFGWEFFESETCPCVGKDHSYTHRQGNKDYDAELSWAAGICIRASVIFFYKEA